MLYIEGVKEYQWRIGEVPIHMSLNDVYNIAADGEELKLIEVSIEESSDDRMRIWVGEGAQLILCNIKAVQHTNE
jgi:hypothetical protein